MLTTSSVMDGNQGVAVLGPFPHPVEMHFPHLRRGHVHRATLAIQAVEPEVETFGWDTVFAVSIADVNRAITRAGIPPMSFQFEDEDGSVTGTFGTWQLCRGGDGNFVCFAIPITAGAMHFGGKSYPIAGITVIVELRLCYLSQTETATPQGSYQNLVVRTHSTNPDEPLVTVRPLKYSGQPLRLDVGWVMEGYLQAWFNRHLENFNHVFATVALNRKVDHDGFEWLAPKYTGYAYVDGSNDANSYLGVLCMTLRPNADGLVAQLSQSAIPKNARAGFLISQGLFLEKMVLPALPKAFRDATEQDFAISAGKTAITNTRPVKTKTVTHDNVTYYPELEELKVRVVGDELWVESHTQVELSSGIWGHIRSTHFLRLKLVNKPDGTQTISYEESRDATVDTPWTTFSSGIEIGKIILEIFAAIVTLVLTVLTAGAFLVVALIIVGLVMGLAIAAPDIVAAVLKKDTLNDVPPIDLLVLNSTAPITWSGASDFKLTSLNLNGSIQLGGDPGFSVT